MKNIWVAFIFLFSAIQLLGQASLEAIDDIPSSLAATITADNLRAHLTVLASDEYEGRETGTEGNRKAAQYIASYFKLLDLPKIGDDDSYYQNVMFTWTKWEEASIEVNGEKFRHLWDFLSFPSRNGKIPMLQIDEVVFLGYGIDDANYSDYGKKNLKGKTIMIYKGEPMDKKGNSRVTGNTAPSEWTTNWKMKLKKAHEKGVKMVLFIENNLQKEISENRRFLVGAKMTLGEQTDPLTIYANSAYISTNIAKAIMGNQARKVIKARKYSSIQII